MDLISQFTVVYDTPYKTVLMKPDEFMCLSVWKKQNEFMTHEEYKKDALNTLDIILKNEFRFIITDNRETRFKFDDDLDVWYREKFFGQIIQKSQLKRFAIILNESLRLSAMVEDLFEDITLEHKSFTTLEEAYKWVRRPIQGNVNKKSRLTR